MKRHIVLSALLFSFVIILVSGCVPSQKAEEERILPPERLIKKLEVNRRKIKSFKGSGVINITSPQFNGNANFSVLIKKPDSVKVSLFGPFGIDIAEILVTKRNYLFYDILGNNLYTGNSRPEIIKKLFKIDISFDELLDALAGSVNLTDKLRKEPDIFEPGASRYALTYLDSTAGIKSVYMVNIDDLAITGYELSRLGGNNLFEGRYLDFRNFEEVPVPYKTILRNKEGGQNVEIEYRKIEVNKDFGSLAIKLPSDVNKIEW